MTKTWQTPGDLFAASGQYWESFAIHAAVDLDLFSTLGSGAMTSGELADLIMVDEDALGRLMDSMAALGLLTKDGETYCSTDYAKQYLCSSSDQYLGHIIDHHRLMVAGWSSLSESIRKGAPAVSGERTEEDLESFLMGMFDLGNVNAPMVAKQIDFSHRKKLLDLGGGPGAYAAHFCLQNPELQATVFDMPTTQPYAEQTIKRFDLQDRMTFMSGNFLEDSPGTDYDAVWASHIIHGEGYANAREIFNSAFGALADGGLFVVQEFILNDEKDGPVFPALFSLNMQIHTEEGRSYSKDELTKLMESVGFENVKFIALPGTSDLMTAIRPPRGHDHSRCNCAQCDYV